MTYVRLTTNIIGTVLTMYKTLDFFVEKEDTIPAKGCKGRAVATSESEVYKDIPKVYHLEARLTKIEKAKLYQIDGEHDDIVLSDSNGAIESKVWLENIDITYENTKDVDSPWHATLELVVMP